MASDNMAKVLKLLLAETALACFDKESIFFLILQCLFNMLKVATQCGTVD